MTLRTTVVTTVGGLKKEPGYLYFIDGKGDISRIRRAVGHYPGPSGPKEKVAKLGISKDPGFWYYIDAENRVMRRPTTQLKRKLKIQQA